MSHGFWSSGWMRNGIRVVALALVGLIAWRLAELWRASPADLSDANGAILVVAALVSLAAVVSGGLVWVLILRQIRAPVPRDSVGIYLQAQLARYVPGTVWQYAGRVGLARSRGIPTRLTMVSLGVEIVASMTSAAIVGILVLPPGLALTAASGCVVVVAAGWWARGKPPTRILSVLSGPIHRMLPIATSDLRTALRVVPQTTAMWVPVWAVQGVALWLTARAFFAVPASDLDFYAATFALAWLVGVLAVFVPSGIGVREAVIVALLGPRVGHADAIVIAAMSRILLTGADLAGGGASLALSRIRLRPAAATID